MRRIYLRDWREHKRRAARTRDERKLWSLRAVGGRIGLGDHSYLSKIENGTKPYTEDILEGLAREYGCNHPADLLIRPPTDPAGLWTIYDRLRPQQLPQARRVLEALLSE